jgi:hypothetical protein
LKNKLNPTKMSSFALYRSDVGEIPDYFNP